MNKYEIERQLKADYDKFIEAAYNKNVPEDIILKFEKALMVVPPQAHGINFTKVKSIIDKTPEQLSVSDINDIVKLIFNTPLQALYDDLYDAIPEHAALEKFVVKFNTYLQEFQESQKEKRKRLDELSDGVLRSNGNRIIPNGNSY